MNRTMLWPTLAVILASVIWGFSFLSIKVTVNIIPPMTLAFIRFLMASALLILVLKVKEPRTKIDKKDLPLLILAGMVGITMYFFFENNGVKLISASAASLIVASVPIFTMLAEALFFKNTMAINKIISVVMSVLGVFLVVGGSESGFDFSGSGAGFLLMFGAMLSWVIYTIITRPLFKKYSQLAIVCYQTIFGMLSLLPFTLFEETSWKSVDLTVILNVVFMGVFCSALAYYLYVFALDKLGISLSSLFLNLVPLVAVISSCLVLGERLGWMQIGGGVLVIMAVYLAEWERNTINGQVRLVNLENREAES